MTAAKWANAALEGGGCPRLGFVHSLHVEVGPVKLGRGRARDGGAAACERYASQTSRRRQGLSGPPYQGHTDWLIRQRRALKEGAGIVFKRGSRPAESGVCVWPERG